MEPLKDKFENQLINVVLKPKLSDLLNADKVLKILLWVCTHYGNRSIQKTGPDVRQGAAYPQESVLWGVQLLAIIERTSQDGASTQPRRGRIRRSKSILSNRKGKISILNLELRYRLFTAQPQFQAFNKTIQTDYKRRMFRPQNR